MSHDSRKNAINYFNKLNDADIDELLNRINDDFNCVYIHFNEYVFGFIYWLILICIQKRRHDIIADNYTNKCWLGWKFLGHGYNTLIENNPSDFDFLLWLARYDIEALLFWMIKFKFYDLYQLLFTSDIILEHMDSKENHVKGLALYGAFKNNYSFLRKLNGLAGAKSLGYFILYIVDDIFIYT